MDGQDNGFHESSGCLRPRKQFQKIIINKMFSEKSSFGIRHIHHHHFYCQIDVCQQKVLVELLSNINENQKEK